MTKKDVVEAVATALDTPKLEHLIELSSGVVLRARQAPPLALMKVLASYPRPKPPVWFNKAMGREMENPEDPEYVERLKAHRTESSDAILNALILLGTELVSAPKGFPKPDSDGWLEELRELNIPSRPESQSWRYLTWVTFKAVLNEDDLLKIRDEVARLSGVPEDAVQTADRFPGSRSNGSV